MKWAGLEERQGPEMHEDQVTLWRPWPLGLALVGIVFAGRRRKALLLVGLSFLLWSLGPEGFLPISRALEGIPILANMRYLARASLPVILVLSVLVGFGVKGATEIVARVSTPTLRRGLQACLAALVLWGSYQSAILAADQYEGVFWPSKAVPHSSSVVAFERHLCEGPMSTAFGDGRGCRDGFTAVPLVNARNVKAVEDADYRGEAWTDDSLGFATIKSRRADRLEFELKGNITSFIVNQSYYPGWWSFDAQIEGWEGLVKIRPRPGLNEITLFYLPWTWILGMGIWGAAVLYFWLSRRQIGKIPLAAL